MLTAQVCSPCLLSASLHLSRGHLGVHLHSVLMGTWRLTSVFCHKLSPNKISCRRLSILLATWDASDFIPVFSWAVRKTLEEKGPALQLRAVGTEKVETVQSSQG